MATEVFGSLERAAPRQFRSRIKTLGLTGQSPLPKKERRASSLIRYSSGSSLVRECGNAPEAFSSTLDHETRAEHREPERSQH